MEPIYFNGRNYRAGETLSAHPAIVEGFAGRVKVGASHAVNQGDAWFNPPAPVPGLLAPSEAELEPTAPIHGPLVVVRALIAGGLLGNWVPNEVNETREMSLRDAAKCIIRGGAVIDTPLSDDDLAFARKVVQDPLVAY